MKILVTGGSGLVGRYVVDHLASAHAVSILDRKPPHRSDLRFIQSDILDLNMMFDHVRDVDAVVHLAGIPHPLNDPPEEVFRVNTMGTFNVLSACERNAVRTLVFLSSESTLGFAFSTMRMWPSFLPIDESHATRPQDAYGLSKLAGELLCSGFTRKTGIQTTCLRAPWIWVPEPQEIVMYRRLVDEYEQWWKNLWAYIHVGDVARAIECALGKSNPGTSRSYFICADENWTGRDSRELAARFFPETTVLSERFQGSASFISNRTAREELAFVPGLTRRDVFD